MAKIVLADDGLPFDGRSLDERPLGGAETAFVELANALAARGHDVYAYTRCQKAILHRGVSWQPLSASLPPDHADLYIANRGDKVLTFCPKAERTIFWLHNPASYLLKWRYQWKLALRRSVMVFLGQSHQTTYPAWALGGRRVTIPLGLSDLFRASSTRSIAPPPRVIFTSNPLRSLDWLLDLWREIVHPALPHAEFHIFSGSATYGSNDRRMDAILEHAAKMQPYGVILRDPLTKAALAQELISARVMAYRGDIGETFCLAVAEAQAMGLPAVVQDIACLKERVIDGKTGFVTRDRDSFAARLIDLLQDDHLWKNQHQACIQHQQGASWNDVAERFERVLTATRE